MIEAYLRDLSAQLGRLGVRGRRRRRILAEIEDHLLSDPDAAGRFGDPAAIAQAFADDIGTRGALRAPLWAFAALAAAGVFYTAMLVAWSGFGAGHVGRSVRSASGAFQMVASGRVSGLAVLAVAVMVVAPQVAFVTGVLALLRALRFRGRRSVPAAEVRTLRRRTATAVGFGVVSMGAVALFALQLGVRIPAWSAGVLGWGVVGAAASGALLVASGAASLRSSTVRVAVAGTAGDIFDDVGPAVPAPLRGHPWAFAASVSGAAALLVWVAGIAASDPYDGAARGIVEGAACFIGFAILGRFLALRS